MPENTAQADRIVGIAKLTAASHIDWRTVTYGAAPNDMYAPTGLLKLRLLCDVT